MNLQSENGEQIVAEEQSSEKTNAANLDTPKKLLTFVGRRLSNFLTESDKRIIEMRFGWNVLNRPYSGEEVAHELSVSLEAIFNAQDKFMELLRNENWSNQTLLSVAQIVLDRQGGKNQQSSQAEQKSVNSSEKNLVSTFELLRFISNSLPELEKKIIDMRFGSNESKQTQDSVKLNSSIGDVMRKLGVKLGQIFEAEDNLLDLLQNETLSSENLLLGAQSTLGTNPNSSRNLGS
jgi:DNA-directed RNA polymerase sigma subunit (sigma70/sigma32)